MKRLNFTLVVLLVVCALFVSCEEDKSQFVSITVSSKAPDFAVAKTLIPAVQTLEIDHYSLNASGPEGRSVKNVQSNTGNFTLENIYCGVWNFEVTAYNCFNNPVAKGNKSQEIKQTANKVDLDLNEIPGVGTVELGFSTYGDFLLNEGDSAHILLEIYDEGRDSKTSFTRAISSLSNPTVFTQEAIAAGSYIVSASLYKNNVFVTSTLEAIRIVAGAKTRGSIKFLVDNSADISNLFVQNTVVSPIEGSIKVQRRTAANGQKSYVLTFIPTKLPTGITADKLTYRWYSGGIQVHKGNLNTIEVSPNKDSEYTVMVSTFLLGSTGSTKIYLKGLENNYPGSQTELPKSVF